MTRTSKRGRVRRWLVVCCYLLASCSTTDPTLSNPVKVESEKESEPSRSYKLKRPIQMYNFRSRIPLWEQDRILDWIDDMSKKEQEQLFDRYVPEWRLDQDSANNKVTI